MFKTQKTAIFTALFINYQIVGVATPICHLHHDKADLITAIKKEADLIK